MSDTRTPADEDLFRELAAVADTDGTDAMFDRLAAALGEQGRWHAVFDTRLLQARAALGLPLAGDPGPLDPPTRDRLDAASLEACREAGWPLLEQGQVSAGWMYLRAAAEPEEVARRLAARAALLRSAPADAAAGGADDEPSANDRSLQEIIEIALWEGIDPALGLSILLERNGTCNAITAFEQGVSRLPADAVYPGEPPFEAAAEASRLFFGAQLGHDVEKAVRFFTRAAATARLEETGTLPADTLTVLLTRLGRPAEALHAALARPREESMPSPMQTSGMLPSLVDLAAAGDAWEVLRAACRERGDAVTFAATLAAERRRG